MGVEYLLEMCHEEKEFIRDFMAQPVAGAAVAATESSSEMIVVSDESPELLPPSTSSRACIISLDNSAAIPLPAVMSKSKPPRCPTKKRTSERGKGEKKNIKTLDHAMGERKRRLELAHKFIQLSTIIPRSNKTNKASIVAGATNYVEQLQKRVKELEAQQNKRGKEPMILFNKENSCEMNLDNCFRPNELLPDVKVKVSENNILIYINCEKENGIQHKILDMLQNLHLFVTSTSVLPFGNSTLAITIIAQMGDAYKVTQMDLVDNIRQFMLKDAT
ncbi:helix loop helix DNA-binding domain protein [Medicago truncatula]|uniref:Helix loop helix DNA-binding domain protein n=2 Tax=Medicago truncatula TaxID=3880 RepID=G7IMA8_MEDTR|nr:helix loop helix DNA-binding domain protein [Medicago truncatula]